MRTRIYNNNNNNLNLKSFESYFKEKKKFLKDYISKLKAKDNNKLAPTYKSDKKRKIKNINSNYKSDIYFYYKKIDY